jgi:hypothetical protein
MILGPNPAQKLSQDAQETLTTIFCIFQQINGAMLADVHNLLLLGQDQFFSFGDYAAMEAFNNIHLADASDKVDMACRWLWDTDIEAIEIWSSYISYLSQKQGQGWRLDKDWFDAKIFAKLALGSRNIIVEELNGIQDELHSAGCSDLSKAIVDKIAALSGFTEVSDKTAMAGDDLVLQAYLEPLYLGSKLPSTKSKIISNVKVSSLDHTSSTILTHLLIQQIEHRQDNDRRRGLDMARPNDNFMDLVSGSVGKVSESTKPAKPNTGAGVMATFTRFFYSNARTTHHLVPNL